MKDQSGVDRATPPLPPREGEYGRNNLDMTDDAMQNEATSQLKVLIETNIIKRFVQGSEIIDLEMGTSGATIPLVASGYRLTGLSSSQATLDEIQSLAGDASIALQRGDILHLPYQDSAFDSAVSLNVLTHAADWRALLHEWKRILRPNGRMVFNMHSFDHVVYACGTDKSHWPSPLQYKKDGAEHPYGISLVSTDELIEFADEAGLSVIDVVPYGAFLGSGNINWLLYSELETKNHWKRTLSWFARDPMLLTLGLFLEESLVSRLPSRFAGQMFVILEKKADIAANAQYKAEIAARDVALQQHDLAALQPWLPLTPEQYSNALSSLLGSLRNKHFFFLLYQYLITKAPNFNFRDAIPGDVLHQLESWTRYNNIDQEAVAIARSWSTDADFKYWHGVDITVGAEYVMVKELLEKHFELFSRNAQ